MLAGHIQTRKMGRNNGDLARALSRANQQVRVQQDERTTLQLDLLQQRQVNAALQVRISQVENLIQNSMQTFTAQMTKALELCQGISQYRDTTVSVASQDKEFTGAQPRSNVINVGASSSGDNLLREIGPSTSRHSTQTEGEQQETPKRGVKIQLKSIKRKPIVSVKKSGIRKPKRNSFGRKMYKTLEMAIEEEDSYTVLEVSDSREEGGLNKAGEIRKKKKSLGKRRSTGSDQIVGSMTRTDIAAIGITYRVISEEMGGMDEARDGFDRDPQHSQGASKPRRVNKKRDADKKVVKTVVLADWENGGDGIGPNLGEVACSKKYELRHGANSTAGAAVIPDDVNVTGRRSALREVQCEAAGRSKRSDRGKHNSTSERAEENSGTKQGRAKNGQGTSKKASLRKNKNQ